MDKEPPFESGFLTHSAFDGRSPTPAEYTGAFFTHAQHFVVAGGSFNSTTNIHHVATPEPSDYRRIPLGDLNLIKEMNPGGAPGFVRRRKLRASVRRIYSARIHGSTSTMTVVLYQGEDAEEKWRKETSRYAGLRHPYLLQLYGIVNTGVIHAAVVHDDLIPEINLWQTY
ncbi:hypothetical protein K438DRAFT_2030104, partial [Mycena galopus ATCC 62051]